MNVQDFKEKLFDQGTQFGFTDMELYYEREEKFGCGVYKGEIDRYESSEVAGVSFRGVFDGNMGYSFTEKLDDDSIVFLLENAKENSLILEDDDKEEIFAGSKVYSEKSFYSTTLQKVSVEDKINLMLEIERELYAYDERVTGTNYFILNSSEVELAIMNSKGLSLQEKKNYLVLFISVVVKQGDEIKTGSYVKITKDFTEIEPQNAAKHAVEEALAKLGSKAVDSKQYPVLLRNNAAASLLETFIPTFSAEVAQKGQSQLNGKVGQFIGVNTLNIVDDPFLPDGLLSRTFDGEGVATKKLQVVSNGTLTTLLHNQKTAKKGNTVSTGHAYKASYKGAISVAPSNLYIEPTTALYDELLSALEEGIIITGLSGLHSGANQVSGNFSLAATGLYVKNGKVETSVNQMTIAGNFYELLSSIKQIGADLEFSPSSGGGYIGSPSLVVEGLSVTVE
jgi:PmbA protein